VILYRDWGNIRKSISSGKKHLNRFIAGMVGYGFMLPFTIFIGKKVEAGNLIMVVIALFAVIPFLLAMSA